MPAKVIPYKYLAQLDLQLKKQVKPLLLPLRDPLVQSKQLDLLMQLEDLKLVLVQTQCD